jgi:ATP/maltotriose-dependent transcriptional regulator MalT
LDRASGGAGHTVLVTGEAGIGKTSLIESFIEQQLENARILAGACDALFTPRPLGPLYDMAQQIADDFPQLLKTEVERPAIFNAFLEELRDSVLPTIVIIEDVHWADEATLDLIKFLARRISPTDTLLILTYRDDEIGRDHPLRLVLGDIPGPAVTRMKLPRLTQAAVIQLAGDRHRSGQMVYKRTGGNPFFVTEVLANVDQDIPETIRDAVLARFARLSPAAREVVEFVSVVPGKIEHWLLKKFFEDAAASLGECVAMGMLRDGGNAVAFRHELARLAIEDSLNTVKRQSLHAGILQALLDRGKEEVGIARLVHHATRAGDRQAVRELAPMAGKQAAALGAHREAASQYKIALEYADALTPDQKVVLLEARSYECYLTDQLEEAFQARSEAYSIWKNLQQPEKEGESLRWLSRLSWFLGRRAAAERYAADAIEILETLPPGPELAMAYSNLAQLHMLADEKEEAVRWGNKAVKMAESLKDQNILAHALNNVGTAQMKDPRDKKGEANLLRSLQISLDNGFEEHAARAYTNLASRAVENKMADKAFRYLTDGIGYCIERDLDSWKLYMQGSLARLHFEQGQWNEAGETAQAVLNTYRVSPITRVVALAYLGCLRMRRGDPDARSVLDEARELAMSTEELQRIAPVAAARAEAAWLKDDLEQCLKEARGAYDLALRQGHVWWIGTLALWMWRAGGLAELPEDAAEPYRKHISGNWQSAADIWMKMGCRYENALALSDGDEAAQLKALTIFREMGANPAADLMERKLRASGIRSIPRGPRPSTKENPAGLTARQMEVLALLAEGLQNAEIAERLFISPKTVDHHISAILSKLNVSSRAKAVTAAVELGLI